MYARIMLDAFQVCVVSSKIVEALITTASFDAIINNQGFTKSFNSLEAKITF